MKRYFTFLLYTGLLFLGVGKLAGQANTAYYMGGVPQSYYLNPATQPQCDFYLGLPIASQVNFRVTTSGLSASDLYFKDPESDSVITPFHPNGNMDAFINKFGKVETLGLYTNFNLASFGFRVKDMYFSFDATIRSSTSFNLSKDFMRLLILGNEDGEVFDLSQVGFETLEYAEIGVNISRRFGDDLQIGIRPKYLAGLATVSSINNNTSVTTGVEHWVIDADYQARIGITGTTIPVDEDGLIDPDGDFQIDSVLVSPEGYRQIFSNNWGLGVDLGLHYMPVDNLQLSLSILDLGYIKWRQGTHIASLNGTHNFIGINASRSDSVGAVEDLWDTLKTDLSLSGTDAPFTTTLNPKILVGGRYFLTQGFDVGVLSRTEFYPTFVDQDVVLLANWHPIPMISVSGSYSLFSQQTFGFGLGLILGPLNFYAILDDVPFKYDLAKTESVPLPLPVAQTDYNVRFGLNLVFGCNQKKKAKQDKPLFNSSDWIL